MGMALVALTVSLEFILAPPPYRMVNAGSCDYKKKKKKKKNHIRNYQINKKMIKRKDGLLWNPILDINEVSMKYQWEYGFQLKLSIMK